MLARGLGGIEQALIDYCQAVKLAGFDTLAIIHPDAAIRQQLDELQIPYKTLANHGAWDIFAMLNLRFMLAQIHADIAIAHGNRALSLLKYAFAKRKIVAVTHNYKIKCKNAGVIFCPTLDLIKFAKSQNAGNIYHIPNTVRVPELPNIRQAHNPLIIGSMGRFVSKKGFDVFIESLAILKARNIVFKAIIGGSGEEEENLKLLAAAKDLSEHLQFIGWVEDKAKFFNAIDIFCLPSHHEPFGIVLLEAMAQGLACVSTASEGPSEIIANHEDAILASKGDGEALAAAFVELIENPEKRKLLGENAYKKARQNYDIKVIAEKIKAAIDSL